MSINSKMTAIADEIRTLVDSEAAMGLDDMATNVGNANTEVDTQADLISQILTALDGKVAGGGSDESSGTIVTGDFTYTTEDAEPGTYDYTLSSDTLQSSTRRIIIVFTKDNDGYSHAWKVLYRADLNNDFKLYLGSSSYIYHGLNTVISENVITVVATSLASSIPVNFWFLAF